MAISEPNKTLAVELARALGAVTLSALLLLLVFIVNWVWRTPEGANTSHSKTLKLREFAARVGEVRIDDDSLAIVGLQTIKKQQNVLVSSHISFNARSYPFLGYQIEGLKPGVGVNLVWRVASYPKRLFTTPLPLSLDGQATVNLLKNDNWAGKVTEIGIHLYGNPGNNTLRISALSLQPYSWQGLLAATWSEWTSFKGWDTRSINFQRVAIGPPGSGAFPTAAAIAAWAGLSILLLMLANRRGEQKYYSCYGIVILLVWLFSDALWQHRLWPQAQETYLQFHGKNTQEKLMASADADTVAFIQAAKLNISSQDARVFIASSSDYFGMLSAYYLSPLNTFWHRRGPELPAAKYFKEGDYILLAAPSSANYDASKATLNLKDGPSVSVELLFSSSEGALLRVTP